MINFELLGCSGVGKTTFCKNLRKFHPNSFLFREDFEEVISQYAIKSFTLNKINDAKKINIRKINLKPSLEKYLIEYFQNILRIEDYFLKKSTSKAFVNDDGFSHNFSEEIEEIQEQEFHNLEKIFCKKKIIYITASKKTIIENLIKRSEENPGAANDWINYAKKNNLKIENLVESFIERSLSILRTVQKLGAQCLVINLEKDYMENIKLASDFISKSNMKLNMITKEDFFYAAQKHPSAHWRTQPLENRWHYHSLALSVLENLTIEFPEQVLELGTVGIQLIPGSETMDIDGYWEYEGKSPTYLHNARDLPWPVRKKYEAIVALRVFQYLGSKQKSSFLEAKRLTKNLIIVVPRGMEYIPKGLEDTKGITYEEFLNWNDGVAPKKYIETNLGDFYHWEF